MGNFFKCLWITVVLWGVGRFVPSLVNQFLPGRMIIILAISLAFLYLGWLAANKISDGEHPKCIRTNLKVMIVLEAFAIGDIFTMITNLSFTTGQFSTDVNGIPYSDYPILIAYGIAFMASYIALCVFLSKKTKETAENDTGVENSISSVKYEGDCLIVEFSDGVKYAHKHFPESKYKELVSANNVKKYYENNILGKYPASII